MLSVKLVDLREVVSFNQLQRKFHLLTYAKKLCNGSMRVEGPPKTSSSEEYFRPTKVFWAMTTIFVAYMAVLLIASTVFSLRPSTNMNKLFLESAMILLTSRIYIMCFIASIFLVLLIRSCVYHTSLYWLKNLSICIAAWEVALFIDDHLILYQYIDFTQSFALNVLILIRPAVIIALFWLVIEISVKHHERTK